MKLYINIEIYTNNIYNTVTSIIIQQIQPLLLKLYIITGELCTNNINYTINSIIIQQLQQQHNNT